VPLSRNVYRDGEANWGRPARREAAGGSHLTFEIPLRYRDSLVGLLLHRGVHGGDASKLYFPHDLIRVGEAVPDAVARIVRAACGAEVRSLTPVGLESWTGDEDHWHVCYTTIATVRRLPEPGGNVRAVVRFGRDSVPAVPFAWWDRKSLRWLVDTYF
jgi:hypothetical protein